MGSTSRILVVTGTGTGVGKTHVASALLAAWGKSHQVVGYKPVETGVPAGSHEGGDDARSLARASTFHVKRPVFVEEFAQPISPHLAARRTRRRISIQKIVEQSRALARVSDGIVVELAGGLFTPLGPEIFNADLVQRLDPWRVILVAPDRLGVLHDVGAALRAAGGMGFEVSGVVLSAPAVDDDSTGTNAAEIERIVRARVLATFPRAGDKAAGTRQAARRLAQALDI